MKIREFLQQNNLKQVDLAKYLEISEPAVSALVKEKAQPSQENLTKILNNPYNWDTSALSQDSTPTKYTTDATVQRLTAEVAELKAQIKWYQNLIETLTKK